MAFKIIYTEESITNLEFILDYIRADNPDAANRLGTSVLNHVGLLASFPKMGTPVNRRANVRKLFHSPLRVYYRFDEAPESVTILHFWHAARRPPKI